MEFTAKQIADFLGGNVEGDSNATVSSFTKIEEGKKGALTFLANPKYTHYIYDTEASVVLVDNNVRLERPTQATLIRVDNAYDCVAKLLRMYEQSKPQKRGTDPLAFVAPTATVSADAYVGPFAHVGEGASIGDGAQIMPHAYIGDRATIGKNTVINPNTTIYHDCRVGNNVIIHAGAVVGADGFGFAPTNEGYDKIPQIGIVTIEDNVEIGANTCVDRSTMGATVVGKGTKIDNLVQIAHNVEVGENTVMSAQVGIAGSTKVGSWCMFGGQVGLAGHITIGDKVQLGAQSGVPGNIKDEQTLLGTPPMEPRAYFKAQAIFRKLPELYKEINELKKQVEELKNQHQ